MQRLENVIYDYEPQKINVGTTIVDVCVSAELVEMVDEMTNETYDKWKCVIDRYTSSEYIAVLHAKNVALEQQITEAQLGIVEMYEILIE